MIGAILLAHLVGDYVIQSDWMATQKVKRMWPAVVHGATYTLPFLLITTDWAVLSIIAGTHTVVDRWRLARYLVWAKNWVAPLSIRRGSSSRFVVTSYNPPWAECSHTGYSDNRPLWLTAWLLVIADNTVHVLVAVAALRWVG